MKHSQLNNDIFGYLILVFETLYVLSSFFSFKCKSTPSCPSRKSLECACTYFQFLFPECDTVKELCTFKDSENEWRYQHFYECKTCNITSDICVVCINVCHVGHDVKYDKYCHTKMGCKCGKKGSQSCLALSQRTLPTEIVDQRDSLVLVKGILVQICIVIPRDTKCQIIWIV